MHISSCELLAGLVPTILLSTAIWAADAPHIQRLLSDGSGGAIIADMTGPSGTTIKAYQFFASPNHNVSVGLSIVNGLQVPLYHTHGGEVVLVAEGTATFVDCNGREEHAEPGDLILIEAGRTYAAKDLRGYRHIDITFKTTESAPTESDVDEAQPLKSPTIVKLNPTSIQPDEFVANVQFVTHRYYAGAGGTVVSAYRPTKPVSSGDVRSQSDSRCSGLTWPCR